MAAQASMQFGYGIVNQKTTSSTGSVTDNDSTFFSQLYNLSFERQIYPHLNISAGGLFEKDETDSQVSGSGKTTATSQTLRPFASMALGSDPFQLGLNYYEQRITSGETGNPSSTIIQDSYAASFSWRPYALPPLSLYYTKFHTYDITHLQTDIVNNTLNYSTTYNLLTDLRIAYSGSYGTIQNKLNLVTNKIVSNGVQANYWARWGETSVSAGYGFSDFQETTDSVRSTGQVYFRVIPFDAFSRGPDVISATAVQFQINPNDTTYENRALMDGDTKAISVGNNGSVNIGTGGNPTPNITQFFHLGVEFQDNPASNALFIYVNQDISNIMNFNPDNAFLWSVYTSNDGRTWTPVITFAQAVYETIDPLGLPSPGFEIDLPTTINASWVQVTVSPLSSLSLAAVPPDKQKQLANIFVTEFRVFEKKPAQQVQGSTQTSTLQNITLNFHTIVLENPRVAFNMNYVANSQGLSSLSFVGSGGLALEQSFRLSKTLTGTASFYTQEAEGQRTGEGRPVFSGFSFVYNADLTWVPAPTLKSSLLYSGLTSFAHGLSQSNSVFLDNTAQLYPGISLFLNGGGTSGNYLFSGGASFIPYRTVTIGLNYSENISNSFTSRSLGSSMTFSPFSNLYLSVSANRVSNDLSSSTAMGYNVGWSPLQGGILQLGFSYDESLGYGLNVGKARTVSSYASLRLAASAFLDVTYSIQKSENDAFQTNTNSLFLQFRKML